MQYFVVGLIYGGLPATIYGFFLGYLAVPSYVYSTVVQIVTLPWVSIQWWGRRSSILATRESTRAPYCMPLLHTAAHFYTAASCTPLLHTAATAATASQQSTSIHISSY